MRVSSWMQVTILSWLIGLLSGCATLQANRPLSNGSFRHELLSVAAQQGLTEADLLHRRPYLSVGETVEIPLPGPPIEDQDALLVPFEVTPDVRRFAEAQVRSVYSSTRRVAVLIEAIYGLGGLDELYRSTWTRTATEVLRNRRGNCFAFSNLFVAAARAVGLPAFYMDASRANDIVRTDDTGTVYGRHIVAAVPIDGKLAVIDFSRVTQPVMFQYQPLTDREVVALFYNNLGHEALLESRDGAPFFKLAIQLAPNLEPPWNNLATLLMRRGEEVEAERVLLTAVSRELKSFAPYFNLGLLEMRQGRYAEAEGHFRKAYRLRRDNSMVVYNLGLSYLRQGNVDKARWAFQRAVRLDRSMKVAQSKLDRLG